MDPKSWVCELILPHWLKDRSPDPDHPHRRRFTCLYRRKKGVVRSLWIGSGLLMIVVATPALILTMVLATTFLSFVILDETT